MPKAFVVGIGGTGSRVIRTMISFLAAGVETNGFEIVPVLIDIDKENKDTKLSLTACKDYVNYRNSLGYQNEVNKSDAEFFRVKVSNLEDRYDELNAFKINISVDNNSVGSNRFRDYIDYKDSSTVTGDEKTAMLFLESLFSTSVDKSQQELELDTMRGFKGHPNIGTVVFNELESEDKFKSLMGALVSGEGNRLFLINSLFGGTGASGFPQFMKIFEMEEKAKNLTQVKIGALCVQPYFNVSAVAADGDNSINSQDFRTKTKSALQHYEKSPAIQRVDKMYYISDDPTNEYKNCSGGAEQNNEVHFVEYLGATAIFDFLNTTEFRTKSCNVFHLEQNVGEKLTDLSLSHLPPEVRKHFLKLTKGVLAKYLVNLILTSKDSTISAIFKDLTTMDRDAQDISILNNFSSNMENMVITPLKETKENSRSLNVVNFNFEPNNIGQILALAKPNFVSSDEKLINGILKAKSGEIAKEKTLSINQKLIRLVSDSVDSILN